MGESEGRRKPRLLYAGIFERHHLGPALTESYLPLDPFDKNMSSELTCQTYPEVPQFIEGRILKGIKPEAKGLCEINQTEYPECVIPRFLLLLFPRVHRSCAFDYAV